MERITIRNMQHGTCCRVNVNIPVTFEVIHSMRAMLCPNGATCCRHFLHASGPQDNPQDWIAWKERAWRVAFTREGLQAELDAWNMNDEARKLELDCREPAIVR